MANLNNVRLFVIDALKKYHAALSTAQDEALTEMLADYVTRTEAGTSYITYAYAGATYLTKSDATTLYPTYAYIQNTYVAKEAGKGLSTNDFTNAYMTKLDAIEAGAQVNKIESITVDGAATTITNKAVNVDLSNYPTAAEWDSTNHKIIFYHGSTALPSLEINGADFIKDGMIDAISITTGTGTNAGKNVLKIDFNTDAESTNHTDIEIPLDDIFNPDNYYDKTTADSTFLKPADQTKLSMSGSAPASSSTNHAKVISQLTVSDHAITASYTDVLTGETNLTLGSASGTGNVISGLSVSGHQITATYTQALTTETQEAISLSGSKPTAATNRTAVVTDIVASGTKNHTLTISYANVVTNETQLSLAGTRGTDGTDTTSVAAGFSVSDHKITVSYTNVLKSHQDISGKEDKTNKKDAIIGNESSSDYYASTKAVATYVGSLAELTDTELEEIFGA